MFLTTRVSDFVEKIRDDAINIQAKAWIIESHLENIADLLEMEDYDDFLRDLQAEYILLIDDLNEFIDFLKELKSYPEHTELLVSDAIEYRNSVIANLDKIDDEIYIRKLLLINF